MSIEPQPFPLRDAPPFAQNGAYGDDTGAANPGHENPIGFAADRRDKGPRVRKIPARV
jgi:hypothetical protein